MWTRIVIVLLILYVMIQLQKIIDLLSVLYIAT